MSGSATLTLTRCFPTTARTDDYIQESSLPTPRGYWVDHRREEDEGISFAPAMRAPGSTDSDQGGTKHTQQHDGRAADHDHLLSLRASDAVHPPAPPLRPYTGTRLFGPDAIFLAAP